MNETIYTAFDVDGDQVRLVDFPSLSGNVLGVRVAGTQGAVDLSRTGVAELRDALTAWLDAMPDTRTETVTLEVTYEDDGRVTPKHWDWDSFLSTAYDNDISVKVSV